jgi:hypothetical protein
MKEEEAIVERARIRQMHRQKIDDELRRTKEAKD